MEHPADRKARKQAEREAATKSAQGERTPDEILDALETREATFVRAILRGLSPVESAVSAGWHSERTAMLVLGRPHVRDALLALAPLLAVDKAGEARAREILRPYALARIAGLLAVNGQNGLAAARDLLDSEGSRGSPGDLRRRLEERARTRGGTADNAAYAPSRRGHGGSGEGTPTA